MPKRKTKKVSYAVDCTYWVSKTVPIDEVEEAKEFHHCEDARKAVEAVFAHLNSGDPDTVRSLVALKDALDGFEVEAVRLDSEHNWAFPAVKDEDDDCEPFEGYVNHKPGPAELKTVCRLAKIKERLASIDDSQVDYWRRTNDAMLQQFKALQGLYANPEWAKKMADPDFKPWEA